MYVGYTLSYTVFTMKSSLALMTFSMAFCRLDRKLAFVNARRHFINMIPQFALCDGL